MSTHKEPGPVGRCGWPLVPSTRFPGETTIACPRCGSTNVVLSCYYGSPGSGPRGRGRLGDPGGGATNECESCGLFVAVPYGDSHA